MANEPENLVLELLREMRGDIVVLRERAEEHSEQPRLDRIEGRLDLVELPH
ncbi:MAG TPA: hypothetical protein VHT48_00225 [Methylocella sp.]|jgi:hypothetical protein|nr:hypothetical protein [Methylocella sp.]